MAGTISRYKLLSAFRQITVANVELNKLQKMILFLILHDLLHVHAGVIKEIQWSKCSVTCGDGFQCSFVGEVPHCRPCQKAPCLSTEEMTPPKARLKINSQGDASQDGAREMEWSEWGPCCPETPQKSLQKRQLICSYGDSACSSTPFESRPCKLQFEGNPYGYIKRRRRDLFNQPPTRSRYADSLVTGSSVESGPDSKDSSQDLDLSSVENYLVGRINTRPKDWFQFEYFIFEKFVF